MDHCPLRKYLVLVLIRRLDSQVNQTVHLIRMVTCCLSFTLVPQSLVRERTSITAPKEISSYLFLNVLALYALRVPLLADERALLTEKSNKFCRSSVLRKNYNKERKPETKYPRSH